MIKTKIVYLEYIDEFESYGISKQTIAELKKQNIVADIRLPKGFNAYTSSTAPTLGFLLGQDKSSITKEEFYTISEPYLETTLKTGAKIKFLDFENTYEQCKNCHGIILPGGAFDNPDNFFIDNKNLPFNENKRYFAYHCAIMNAHKNKKPMLGICAGAQMIGAILGKMKMYRSLKEEIPHPAAHKPQPSQVIMHDIKLIPNTPIFDIMNLSKDTSSIKINSRHNQAMVHPSIQDYVKETPLTKMDIYAISNDDNLPEIWGNSDEGILCIQGHPEDLAAKGDVQMQSLYNHVAILAKEYKKKHPQKISDKIAQKNVDKKDF